jgi:hypothetical protein
MGRNPDLYPRMRAKRNASPDLSRLEDATRYYQEICEEHRRVKAMWIREMARAREQLGATRAQVRMAAGITDKMLSTYIHQHRMDPYT